MSGLVELKPEAFTVNPFDILGNQWMLVAAEKAGKVNAMTAAWGGFGVMWRRNVAFIVIRPQRYTREFIDASATFSLNFFDSSHKKTLGYFGAVSGRDEDKIAKTGLTVALSDGAPYFGEARMVVLCRKLYAQPYKAECFVDPAPDAECYPEKDYHIQYIGEVVRILAKQ